MGDVLEFRRPDRPRRERSFESDLRAESWPVRLRELRSEAGLTQRELAERVGVDGVTVRRWERGDLKKAPFLAEHCSVLAALFGVTTAFLMGWPGVGTAG